MTPGEIIFQGKTKKGRDYFVRYIEEADVLVMKSYINTLSKEKTFITLQGEQYTTEEERKFVESILDQIENKKGFALLAFCEGILVGLSTLQLKHRTSSHEGVLGISIACGFRNEGIGSKLFSMVLQESEALPELKIISLGVFANNPLAIKMYDKFGFKEGGRIPKGILHQGKYVDHIYMYKFVNRFK